jgi:hypothetical protein
MKTIKTTSMAMLLLAAMSFSTAFARQPHMEAALKHLREARASLEKAIPNKGGHRERAIDLINQAIAQVEEGDSRAVSGCSARSKPEFQSPLARSSGSVAN